MARADLADRDGETTNLIATSQNEEVMRHKSSSDNSGDRHSLSEELGVEAGDAPVKASFGIEVDQVGMDESDSFDAKKTTLAAGEEVNIYEWNKIGILAQYFAVGIIYGGLPATVYGMFLGYLSVPAYVYATASVITTLPWSFKFAFGMLNDCRPILGYRRKPYMVVGWLFCMVMLLVLSGMPMPPPYWCVGEDGYPIKHLPGQPDHPADPCHPHSATQGGRFAILMMMAALGYVLADVAADGLLVEYARLEPFSRRGQTQTLCYFTRTVGSILAHLVVGFGMSGKLYNGHFDHSLTFNQVCFIFAVPTAVMVPVSWYLVYEQPYAAATQMRFRDYLNDTWHLLQSKAVFFVVVYQFGDGLVSAITTPAGANVKQYWAQVGNLQNECFSIVGSALFAVGLWSVKRYFLHMSWRRMLLYTALFLNGVDMFFTFCTVMGVVRNQYFYLGETVLFEVPHGVNFVVSTLVIVEISETGTEGLTYGLMTTIHNLGDPFARALANQLFQSFKPSLSDGANYVKDTPHFRRVVAASFVLSYFFSFLSLGFLYFLPSQKAQAQRWKATWPHKKQYAVTTVVVLVVSLIYSVLVNLLSMFPSTMCLKFAGGEGC